MKILRHESAFAKRGPLRGVSSWRPRSGAGLLPLVAGISLGAHPPGRALTPAAHEVAADSGTVSVNGTHLFYEEAGSGSVVVLLHAGMLDRRMWNPQFEPFAREHRVIRYDIRGYGKSGPADAPYRSADDLYGLLQALHVRRASLVGLSLGGRIAMDFALDHPEMVDRLVLASPGLSGWTFSHSDTAYFPAARRARDRGDAVALGLSYLGSAYVLPAMEHPDLVAPLREMTATNGKHWMEVLKLGDLERVEDPPALHRTSEIPAPVLLVIGSRDVPDIQAIADTLQADVPNLRRVTFEGAGHLVSMEQPERFTKLVLDFLRPSVEPGARVRVTRPCASPPPAMGELPCRLTGRVVAIGADSLVVKAEGDGLARYRLQTIERLEVGAGPRPHRRSGAIAGTVAGGVAAYLTFFTGGSTAICDRSANQDAANPAACAGILALGGLAGAGLGVLAGGLIRTETWHDVPIPQASLGVRPGRGLYLHVRIPSTRGPRRRRLQPTTTGRHVAAAGHARDGRTQAGRESPQ